jgi:cytochrome c
MRVMKIARQIMCLLTMLAWPGIVYAEGRVKEPPPARASDQECVAFVKRAAEEIRQKGADAAFAEFNNKQGPFIDRDLYIIAYDMQGMTLAHGGNPALVGRDRLDEQDSDGIYFNREKIEHAKTETSFWQKLKFTDPLTHKLLRKATYCEVVREPVHTQLLVCAGIYLVDQKNDSGNKPSP